MGYSRSRTANPSSKTLLDIGRETRDHVLREKGQNLINVLKVCQRNAHDDLIGERELRKLLFDYLDRAPDLYISTIIGNLRYSRDPDDSNFFRRFNLTEIISTVQTLMIDQADDSPGLRFTRQHTSLNDRVDELNPETFKFRDSILRSDAFDVSNRATMLKSFDNNRFGNTVDDI